MSVAREYLEGLVWTLVVVGVFALVMSYAPDAWAGKDLEKEAASWLGKIGDLLTKVVGPGVLLIGFAACGVMFATGNQNAKGYALYVAVGGGFVVLAGAAAGFFGA